MSGPAAGRARSRREARERALELAYERDARSWSVDDVVASLVLPLDPFAEVLLRTVEDRKIEIHERISARLTKGWSLHRLPAMDRLLLELAVGELLVGETPKGVVLAETVDLASRYSTDDSSRFVNGVLSAIADN